MQKFIVYHEMDYGDQHFQRGQYAEVEFGYKPNDNSLLVIGYFKEYNDEELTPCLRCGLKFISEAFLRIHEKKCEMIEVEIPKTRKSKKDETTETTEDNPNRELVGV